MFQNMTTSKPFRPNNTQGQLWSAEDHPASQCLVPGSEGARQMTAISGRKLFPLFSKSDPLGACSKTLLGLEIWGSMEFLLNWKITTTPQGRLILELAPSDPRTGECDTGLFADVWATTTAHERTHSPRQVDHGQQLANQVESASPTPASRDVKGQTQNPERSDYIPNILKANWPTPRSEDSESTGAHRGNADTLTSAAKAAWATPKKAESGPDYAIASREDSGGTSLPTQTAGKITSGCLARTEKFVVRLTTLSAWLMGYTAQYLAHWATASSGRSRKKSSQQ